jgi:glyoxylase-like metal-dependent hydrolase (beta-lactamase superfamily II)
MAARQIVPGFYEIPVGAVNVFLLEGSDGLVLFDAGMPNSADQILNDIRALGKDPKDIRHIVLTHAHPDHIGSLAALQKATGAKTYAHPLDALIARKGGDFDPTKTGGTARPFAPAPTFLTRILFRLFIKPYPGIEASTVDTEINDGERLPFAHNMLVIFAPGHSAGELAFLWEAHGGVLIAGDTCANLPFLGWSIGYEDFEEGKRSLKKLCQYNFEVAVFGHGGAIKPGASTKWRKKWGAI